MSSRVLLGVFIAVVLLVAVVLGGMHWWSAWALAQLTPVSDVRWEGYDIEHEERPYANSESFGDVHQVHVRRDGALLRKVDVYVAEDGVAAGPLGFFSGLNADDDDELELVLCQDGVVDFFLDLDRTMALVVREPGQKATSNAHDLCASVARAGRRPALGCVGYAAIPIAVPALLALLILARRERREEERVGRTGF